MLKSQTFSGLAQAHFMLHAGTVAGAGGGLTGVAGFDTPAVTSSGGSISDSLAGAVINIAGGNYNVTASGAQQSVTAGNQAQVNVSLSGAQSLLTLGNPSVSVPSPAPHNNATITGAGDTVQALAAEIAAITIAASASATHLGFTGSVAGGTQTVLLQSDATVTAGVANVALTDKGGALAFVGGSGAATIASGAGSNDSVYAGTGGLNYRGAAAASLFFEGSTVPGSTPDTVSAAYDATIFGGAGGGFYTIGGGGLYFLAASLPGVVTQDYFRQTATSGAGVLTSAKNERLTLASLPGGGAAKGDTLYAAGSHTEIDAGRSAGDNTFVMNSLADGAGALPAAVTGTSTLVGATAGHEEFLLSMDNSKEIAHTITIANWQSSDTFIVSNTAGAGGFLAADSAAIEAFNAGTGSSFKLHDGTTVQFTGALVPRNVIMTGA